jgi:hypothetical protein
MKTAFGKQIAAARMQHPRLSQMTVSRLIGRSQWWLSAVERGEIQITEPVAAKVLLAIRLAGQRAQVMVLAPAEITDLRIGPRSNARFKSLKT